MVCYAQLRKVITLPDVVNCNCSGSGQMTQFAMAALVRFELGAVLVIRHIRGSIGLSLRVKS
jgi:hypothetical protein